MPIFCTLPSIHYTQPTWAPCKCSQDSKILMLCAYAALLSEFSMAFRITMLMTTLMTASISGV